MVKIRIKYNGEVRTFYTRKDWKNGEKLYLYYNRSRKLNGNWYNDEAGKYMSWQDYEREYENQCRSNNSEILSDNVKKMKNFVEIYNDEILELANNGIEELTLNTWLFRKRFLKW